MKQKIKYLTMYLLFCLFVLYCQNTERLGYYKRLRIQRLFIKLLFLKL